MINHFSLLVFLAIVLAALAAPLQSQPSSSDTCIVWITFADKPDQSRMPAITQRGLARRSAAGFRAIGWGDFPVSSAYIKSIERTGARCRQTVKWVNAASFAVPCTRLDAIRSLVFVKDISPVRHMAKIQEPLPSQPSLRKKADMPGQFGASFAQMNMISIPDAHHYLAHYRKENPGHGILIALFDSGFFTIHDCFRHLRDNDAVIADSDFVDHDGSVDHRDAGLDSHGTKTLSLIAGYAPGIFIGTAWDARFLLARTEDDFNETHIEEDNWAAALVWAESLGVDIVSSSVGYRSGFTDSIPDYEYWQMDGKTAISSRAADSATQRGVIIVNAMGNEASNYPAPELRTLVAPADAAGVVSVGGVREDSLIASFSSCGPTADGRMKPDLVAQAVDIMTPDTRPDALSSYTYTGSGTSYSTPAVAGLCALIKQAHATSDADTVKSHLYKSCTLSPFQDGPDNVYGRGIPDGLVACLDQSEVFMATRDSTGTAVSKAVISDSLGDTLGITDSLGNSVISVSRYNLPVFLTIQDSAKRETQRFSVESTPSRRLIHFNLNKKLIIMVYDTLQKQIPQPVIYWKYSSQQSFKIAHGDNAGRLLIIYPNSDSCRFFIAAPGFYNSDTLTAAGEDVISTISVYLVPKPGKTFQIYPTVVSVSKRDSVTIVFVTPQDESGFMNSALKMYVRSATGVLIWKHTAAIDEFTPVIVDFKCRNKEGNFIVPGVYFVIVEANGKQYVKKFLVTG